MRQVEGHCTDFPRIGYVVYWVAAGGTTSFRSPCSHAGAVLFYGSLGSAEGIPQSNMEMRFIRTTPKATEFAVFWQAITERQKWFNWNSRKSIQPEYYSSFSSVTTASGIMSVLNMTHFRNYHEFKTIIKMSVKITV